MRNPRAFGSLAQHSGNFVFMFFCELMVTATCLLETTDMVSGTTAETKQIAVQPIPKANGTTRDKSAREVQGQRLVTGLGYIFAQLVLVWREDANATPPA